MTNAELKAALQSRKPVILDSPRYGKMRYKCVNAIRYTLDKDGNIIVQAELLASVPLYLLPERRKRKRFRTAQRLKGFVSLPVRHIGKKIELLRKRLVGGL